MTHSNIENEYFEWMYSTVCNDKYVKNLSYRKLLMYLHDTEFIYICKSDYNRAIDGIDLRYRFGCDNGYERTDIQRTLDIRPCSILEMMIALSIRCEEHIMDDPELGDRTGQWFWNMIVSLGLGAMNNGRFDKGYVDMVISRFLKREYKPNGEGGMFTLHNNHKDLRSVDIWYQMMWYLTEIVSN